MNIKLLFRLTGIILLCMTIVFSLSAIVENIYEQQTILNWIYSACIPFILSIILFIISSGYNSTILYKDAILIVTVCWIGMTVIGMLPYMAILKDCSLSNAFFESASGYTSTGNSIFGNVEQLPKSILFYRALTQWIGGLGIIIFFVLFLPFLGANTKKLCSNEMSVMADELTSYTVKHIAYNILIIYSTLTILCAITFHLLGMNVFDSLCHTFTTVSTGGMSTYNNSFAHFQSSYIRLAAAIFMIIGGMNFQIISAIVTFRYAILKKNDEAKTYIFIIFLSTILILIIQKISHTNISVIDGLFQIVSILTSTGFSTEDFVSWVPASHVIFIIIMMIGGCTGSTSGGIKVARIVVMFKLFAKQLEQTFRPRIVRTITINGNTLENHEVIDKISFICFYITILFISTLIISSIQPGISLKGALSAVLSSTSNAGIGLAEVGPSHDYSYMHGGTKFLLGLLMLLGRLEIYPIICLFMPTFWRKHTLRTSKNTKFYRKFI